jgi:hypothetical protein
MDGTALVSRFTVPAAHRRSLRPPVRRARPTPAAGSASIVRGLVDRRDHPARAIQDPVIPAAASPFVSARPSFSSARIAARATAARRAAGPRAAGRVAEHRMQAAEAAHTAVVAGTEAADTANNNFQISKRDVFLPSGSNSTSQRFGPFFFVRASGMVVAHRWYC